MFARKGVFFLGVCATVIILSLLTARPAHAAPGKNIPVTVTQPDGTVLNLFASGDEYYNWLHDAQGYTIMQDPETGYYVYADLVKGELVPSEFVAGKADPAAAGLEPHLNVSPATKGKIREDALKQKLPVGGPVINAPTTGTMTNLVIFIRFSDEAEFTTPTSTYNNMLNSSTAGADSLRNYFREVSYNALTINSSLFPTPGSTIVSYQDSHPRGYYQPYNAVTNPIGYTDDRGLREHTLLRDAINYVDGLGQFPNGAAIDGDGDGYVDSLSFVVSGNSDGWSDLLWPHAWSLFTYNVTISGKIVDGYSLHLHSWLVPGGTGVLAHEMFHVLGAPDLYHYADNGIQPVGGWDVMEANFTPPQHMGCYMKYKYGHWISSIPEIEALGTYTLNPLTSATNNCKRINSPYSSTEFFILEYRNTATSTFESSLPGTGLLVYRINTLASGNADGPPDEVYVYRPGGTSTVNGDVNNAHFSSDVGRTVINDGTDPSSFLSDGSAGSLNICSVGAANATINFEICEPSVPVIFADSFESGSLSAWSGAVIGGGDLSTTTDAALIGSYGMQAIINDNTSLYVSDTSPVNESRYRARFYFNPRSIAMASADVHTLLLGRTGSGSNVFAIQLNNSTGTMSGYRIRTQVFNDGGNATNGSYFSISNDTHFIEIDWQAATAAGANNGYISLWIDGVQVYTSPGIDNDGRRVEDVRLGAVTGIDSGTRGTYYFDAFESRRQSYIGPAEGEPPSNTAPVVNAGVDQTITLSSSASLDGAVTDDGLPNPPGTVTTTWSKVSGPGTISFGNPNAVDTSASFSAAGSYVLRLTANDSLLSSSDEVSITVNPSSPPDLVIQSLTSVPANPQVNQPVTFSVVIKNQGSGPASGFWVDLYVDTSLPTGCGGQGQVDLPVDSLAAGASQTLTLDYAGFTTAGDHTVIARVDTDCGVSESNESNNTSSISVPVSDTEPPGSLIFEDNFETGNLSRWTSCTADGGDLSVTTAAKYAGNYGMQAVIDDNVLINCTSDHPDAETRYQASFRFQPNSIPMTSGDTHVIFGGYSGTSTMVLRVQFRKSSGNYQVQAGLLKDGSGWTSTSWQTISGNAYHLIELDWKAATGAGANNGSLLFKVDGAQLPELAGVDNDTRRIDRARLGVVNAIDTGTRGTYYFDEFVSSSGDEGSGSVSVVGAVTADENWNPKTTFAPGDPIQWVLDVQNDTGQDAQIELTFDVRGPNGEQITYSNSVVTTGPGLWSWGLPGTVQSGLDGTYTLYGSVLYQGTLSEVSSTYTVTTAPGDPIFKDGFESGNFSAWTTNTNDSGDLSVTGAAKYAGNYGMQALINDKLPIFVSDGTPNAEPRYRARFYFNRNSVSMVSGNAHFIFKGFAGTDASPIELLRVELRRTSTAYQLRASLVNDGTAWTHTAWVPIPDGWNSIEVDWRAASGAGANNGGLTLWIGGVQKANLTGIDNDTRRIDFVRLGALNGIDPEIQGTYYFDAFESRRQTYIGP